MGVGSRLKPEQLEALAAIGKPSGVKLYLELGARIRVWIRNQSLNVTLTREPLGRRNVRVLSIRGGDAGFLPGGRVGVKMPGSGEFWIAFPPMKVLEIRNLKTNSVIERNFYLCIVCGTLSGKSVVVGGQVVGYECVTCNSVWLD